MTEQTDERSVSTRFPILVFGLFGIFLGLLVLGISFLLWTGLPRLFPGELGTAGAILFAIVWGWIPFVLSFPWIHYFGGVGANELNVFGHCVSILINTTIFGLIIGIAVKLKYR